MARYFFDVTDIKLYLKAHTTVSGIQRVSLEVIREAVRQLGSDRVRLCLWDKWRKAYQVLPSDALATMEGIDVDLLGGLLTGRAARSSRDTPAMLARYRSRPLKYHLYRLIADIQFWRGAESYFAKRGSSRKEWGEARRKRVVSVQPPVSSKARPITDMIEPGDRLVILGAAWGMSGLDAHLLDLKRTRNVRIAMQVHDLIPLVMPHHLAKNFSLEFYRWLETSLDYCETYIVAAQNTRRDMETFMGEVGKERPIQVIPFANCLEAPAPPPEGFKARNRALHAIPQKIRNKTKLPYVLVVGTLESRKNLWSLVQAWDRLSREPDLELPRLVIAGRPGWFNDDLMDWMRASGNLRGWVHFVEGPSDEELAYLYHHCLFTATVSLYEGWGLPIGESLGFGKTAVVADNSAMPEVGGDLVEYCDAKSIPSIAAACRRLIADSDHRRTLEERIAQADLRTWDAVAADYISALTEAAQEGPGPERS